MLEVNSLTKAYMSRTVLDIPSLSINDGESFGLVGNNGAGKTTFFSMVLDLIEATTGEILSKGIKTARSDHWKNTPVRTLMKNFLLNFCTPKNTSSSSQSCTG